MSFINYVTQIQIDFGAVKLLQAECERVGIRKPLIVTDAGVKAAGVLQKALDALPDLPIAVFDQTPSNPTEAERLAIVATGGYGRGVMAPSSDTDLLFLRAYKASPHTESVVEYMLYALWDMGLKVGQVALRFGANDFGSLMMEENVVSSAGTSFRLAKEQIEELIRDAGFHPRRRDNWYRLQN